MSFAGGDKLFKLPKEIDPFLFKQILQDIESSTKYSYKNFKISGSSSQYFYGDSGSKKRSAAFEVIRRLQRKKLSNYKKLLDFYDVDAGLKTLNLLENMKRTNSNDESIDFQDEESFDGSYDDDECEDENTGELAGGTEDSDKKNSSSMAKLSINSRPPSHFIFQTPPRIKYSSSKTKKNRKKIITSPPGSVLSYFGDINSVTSASNQQFLEEYGIADIDPYIIQNGSRSHPFITFVNKKSSEKNGGMHGHDITFVQGIDHNNFLRDAYKICMQVSTISLNLKVVVLF